MGQCRVTVSSVSFRALFEARAAGSWCAPRARTGLLPRRCHLRRGLCELTVLRSEWSKTTHVPRPWSLSHHSMENRAVSRQKKKRDVCRVILGGWIAVPAALVGLAGCSDETVELKGGTVAPAVTAPASAKTNARRSLRTPLSIRLKSCGNSPRIADYPLHDRRRRCHD